MTTACPKAKGLATDETQENPMKLPSGGACLPAWMMRASNQDTRLSTTHSFSDSAECNKSSGVLAGDGLDCFVPVVVVSLLDSCIGRRLNGEKDSQGQWEDFGPEHGRHCGNVPRGL